LSFVKPNNAPRHYLSHARASLAEVQLQSRRDTGRLVTALGVMAIIAVMSTVFAASFVVRSVEVSIMPHWNERPLAAMDHGKRR
jgi:hypothetical protein